jgi:hypothetical protein
MKITDKQGRLTEHQKETRSRNKARVHDRRQKVPVTMRALVQRIDRRIAHDGQMLRSSRSTVPLYYVIDIDRNYISTEVPDLNDLEKWGRELGVLRPWETVSE